MEGKNSWFHKKRFPSYVKIAISCCTHSFYTQLTSSPSIHRKKNKKTGKDKKQLQKRLVREMQH